jgi:signal transduction histidine kinase
VTLPNFLRTAAFKLALLYATIFGLSSFVLFVFLYWSITNYVFEQTRGSIDIEMSSLVEEWRTGGEKTIEKEVNDRSSKADSVSSYYLLQSPAGEHVAGNLGALAARDGSFEELVAPLRAGTNQPRVAVLFEGRILPDGWFLAIGRDLNDIREVYDLVLRAFVIALGASVALAILGGMLMSFGFLKRIEAINRTSETIIRGDLGQRIAVLGTHDELDRLGNNLNRMLDRIQSLMESMQQVSNDIAHDLRTPLARLRQRLERVRWPGSKLADYQREVDSAIADTDDILATFAATLRIAQIEARSRVAGFKAVCLSDLFTTIAEAYAPVAEDQGQRLVASVATGVNIRGDADLLTQMLANIVENALRHCPPGSTIDMRLSNGPHAPFGVVSDDGPGIPEDERAKVFRRFYRLERSRTTPGSGLGLSLVAAVADIHEIRLAVRDNEPGTRLEMQFPLRGAAGL